MSTAARKLRVIALGLMIAVGAAAIPASACAARSARLCCCKADKERTTLCRARCCESSAANDAKDVPSSSPRVETIALPIAFFYTDVERPIGRAIALGLARHLTFLPHGHDPPRRLRI